MCFGGCLRYGYCEFGGFACLGDLEVSWVLRSCVGLV